MVNGGKGANQAVAAARLGARVTLVARVGDEMLGHGAIENFQKEGDRHRCHFVGHPTTNRYQL